MKKVWFIGGLLFFSGFLRGFLFSQEESDSYRKIGLTASVQTTQMDIMFPFRLSPLFTLAPAFSVIYLEDIGTDFGLGVVPKYYLKEKSVKPFVNGRLALFYESPREGKETADIMLGAGFGVDYFINEQISVGIEAQLNATKSDKNSSRFGNPGRINVNTATAVSGTIYF